MVVFDATFLMLLVDAQASPPLDPQTNQPVSRAKERIEFLLGELHKSGERVLIPAPALSEVLVGATGSISDLIAELTASYRLRVAPFDELAAIEVALMTNRASLNRGELNNETKAKVKYDRQIIAIAKVLNASTIYSDDISLREKAESLSIRAIGLENVDLPPEDAQHSLPLTGHQETEEDVEVEGLSGEEDAASESAPDDEVPEPT